MKKLVVIICILLPALLAAQFGAGLQPGARQQGIGNAFTGLADDGEAVYFNPAGLVNLNNIEAMSMYSRQLAHLVQGDQNTGINVSYIGYAQNLGAKYGSLGFRHYYRGYEFGEVFNASEHLFMLAYGRQLGDLADIYDVQWLNYLRPLSAGLGFKFMKYGFYDASALESNAFAGSKSDLETWTWGMDLSLFYKPSSAWSFGFQFKDFNRPNNALIENRSYLDRMDYTLGGAWRYSRNGKDLITADLSAENAAYAFNLGTEKVWDFGYDNGIDEFSLRTGGRIGFEEDYNWTLGVGYLLSKVGSRMDFGFDFDLRFDYAYKVMFGNVADGPGNHCWELVFLLPAVKEYQKPAEVVLADDPDRDRDGLLNLKDKCPDDPEDKDGFEDEDGCPDPDNDRDGVLDVKDKCPLEPEDNDLFVDEDGCPDPDNDQDGILDIADKCPLAPEDKDAFEDEDGCPDPDNDQDGIPDLADKCPNEAETLNGFKDEDGCPDVILTKNTTITLKNVYFETGKADITLESYAELDKLQSYFTDYPKLVVQIEGHTDSQGKKETNKKLSQGRAKAVRDYLVNKFAVSADRIKYVGFGSEKPVADNKTAEGRAKNRRIEFKILKNE